MSVSSIDMVCQWNGGGFGSRGKLFLEALLKGVLWGIWKEK